MRPKLINFDALNPADKLKNLDLALDSKKIKQTNMNKQTSFLFFFSTNLAAAKYCNVEKYLKAEDIAKLDELSMLVYLTDWYNGIR